MAWLNAQGNPVAIKTMTIQIDVPSEALGDPGRAYQDVAANWGAIMSAAIQLIIGLMTGNAAAIAAAIQALINAFMTR